MILSRRGMTLLELVVALVITGLMAGAGAAAFGGIIDHRKTIEQASAATERASALREMIHGWLAAATIAIQQGSGPRLGGRGGSSSLRTSTPGMSSTPSVTAAVVTGDVLSFTTTADNPAMAPSATMRLFVDDDANTPETGLTIEYQANAQTPLLRRQLDPGIDTMAVEFLDSRTNRWYPASQASTITPKALRLTLFPAYGAPASAILMLPIVIPIPQQTPAGR